MNDSFHIDSLDPIGKSASNILKGGPGSGRHAAEGHYAALATNPYINTDTDRSDGGASLAAWMLARHAADMHQGGATGEPVARAHKAAAFEHRIAQQVINNALEKEDDLVKRGQMKAAIYAHRQAEQTHTYAAAAENERFPNSPITRDTSMMAAGMSLLANDLTHNAGVDLGDEFPASEVR
jgi:hypothetical protein